MSTHITTQKHTFYVQGMHCKACVLLTESELGDLPHIVSVQSSLETESVQVEGDFGTQSPEDIARELNTLLTPHGYTISTGKLVQNNAKDKTRSDFKIALPVALCFAVIFVVLQKMGLINIVGGGSMTYVTVFIVGIIASLSSCMAVVGGLLLSMSATFAKEGNTIRPQIMFHVGRIITFFILGGVIGSLGSAFTLNTWGTFGLSFSVGLVMLILGINLLDTFPWARKLQPSMPKFIGKYAHGVTRFNTMFTPLLVGIATFFLPCGFTQSMQLYALGTGSFITGALTMLVFALGTLPVLALISFSSFSIQKSSKAGIFFKTAGLIVIMFALFNIINSLVVIGIIQPLFNF